MKDDVQLIWEPSLFEVGHPQIDRQHRHIAEVVNRLVNLCVEGGSQADLSRELIHINDYVDYHFSTEERLMQQIGYPDLKRHIMLHEQFRERLSSWMLNPQNRQLEEITDYLANWFVDHILHEDMQYKRYLEKMSADELMADDSDEKVSD